MTQPKKINNNRYESLEEVTLNLSEDVRTFLVYIANQLNQLTSQTVWRKLEEEIEAYALGLVDRYNAQLTEISSGARSEFANGQFRKSYSDATYAIGLLYQFAGRFRESIDYFEVSEIHTKDKAERFICLLESSKMRYEMHLNNPSQWSVSIYPYLSSAVLALYEAMAANQDFELPNELFQSGISPQFILKSASLLKMKNSPLEAYHHALLSYTYLEMDSYSESEEHLLIAQKLLRKYPKKLRLFIHQLDLTIDDRKNR